MDVGQGRPPWSHCARAA